MSTGISFCYTLPQRGVFFGVTTPDQMIRRAREVDADDLFDSLWVGDSNVCGIVIPSAFAVLRLMNR